MKLKKVTLLCLGVILNSGCAKNVSNECVWVKEINWTVEDVDNVSFYLAVQLKNHNDKYSKFCEN